jgi:V8-like Glu-specific endopeptidase
MKNSVCKIKCKVGHGTGFFCLIPYPSKLKPFPLLITNNHVLDEEDIENNQIIEFSINNDSIKKKIVIDDLRKTYTSKEFDVTFIEVREEDNLNFNSFLEIDYNIFEELSNEKYKQKSIYLLHYPHSEKVIYSIGVIKFIEDDNYTIRHFCYSEGGSSGGPLLNLSNFKVIGMHKGSKETINMNVGTLIKAPIDEFNKKGINKGDIYKKKNNK